MIKITEMSKRYGKIKVLDKISFSVEKGSCVGLMGESGSGKSTIARLLVGLEPYDAGKIEYNNMDYRGMNALQIKKRKRQIQLVFQNASGAVNPNFSVFDVLTEPLYLFERTLSKEEKRSRAQEMLIQVGLEKVSLTQRARQLSGGQLQRVCIGRALMLKPEVLVLDESLSGLDPLVQRQMLRLLGDLKTKYGLTYIFIAHDFSACYYLCDKIVVMDAGKIVETLEDLDNLKITSPITEKLMGDAMHHLVNR